MASETFCCHELINNEIFYLKLFFLVKIANVAT